MYIYIYIYIHIYIYTYIGTLVLGWHVYIYIHKTVVVFSDGVRNGTSIWGIFAGVVSREPFVLKNF